MPLTAGPIPARAGQPRVREQRLALMRAYPRSRGATSAAAASANAGTGLSPLARGNHKLLADVEASWGPIPARAGQPPAQVLVAWFFRAYPRSRGATLRDRILAGWEQGLSPLARGNQEGRG